MTFDRNGHVTALTEPRGTTTFTWDARQRLAALTGSAIEAGFGYDPLGRRTTRTTDGITTAFYYDWLNSVQEVTEAGLSGLLTSVAIDEHLARTDTTGTYVTIADGLGSSIASVDKAGTLRTEYTYEPFGNTTVTPASVADPHQYTARENDGTGLYYYRARYYHPGLQRFISEDPIGLTGGMNPYAYVGNNPLS